jgi:hypothetical protein
MCKIFALTVCLLSLFCPLRLRRYRGETDTQIDATCDKLIFISVCFFLGSRCLCWMELLGAHLISWSTESYFSNVTGIAEIRHFQKCLGFPQLPRHLQKMFIDNVQFLGNGTVLVKKTSLKLN